MQTARRRPLYESLLLAVLLLAAAPALGQDEGEGEEEATESSTDAPMDVGAQEVLVVTASRVEQSLHDSPAAITVLSDREIETLSADNYGDLLRNVPGINVTQLSARDIQVAGREASGTLSNKQLVLLDGRTLYLDFLGFVMWDFLPISPREIKQIEVVRGPGSAVWGANAMTGVVNVITKSPAEMTGTSLLLGGGEVGTLYGSVTHAGAAEKVSYKVSGTYYEQDPYDRPTGTVPGTDTPYPDFENQGTKQPKIDLRVDVDSSPFSTLSFSAGWAGTDGIINSGIGPFDIDQGSALSYFKVGWTRRAMSLTAFANLLDGEATNLLTIGNAGLPLLLDFDSGTFNLDFNNTSVLGENHILTYGANARATAFDLSVAPDGDDREELGLYVQDEILFGEKVRWVVGGRYDDISTLKGVFSPRTSLLVAIHPDHTLRLSYSEAFRAPSLVENYLDIVTFTILPLPTGPFPLPTNAIGNPELKEEQLAAVELGYVATLGRRSTMSLSVYRNETENVTDFFPEAYYTSSNPPPGWPLPPELFDLPILRDTLPAVFSYRNVAQRISKGVEIAFNVRPSPSWSWFLNYSYQDRPEVEGIPENEINIPPENRFNVGLSYDRGRFFASSNLNFVDEAYWTDVLDERFFGPTDAYTQVNMTLGLRLGERATFSIIGQNIFDEDVQQHVFGDIIRRKIAAQLRLEF